MIVLTNALAGRTEREPVDAVVADLRAGGAEVELVECGDDTDLDTILANRRGRTLVIVGGDGSLHSTVRALWRRGEAADCVVGLVPLGTGNDFARGVGIPLEPAEAVRLILDGRPSPVDLITDEDGGVVVNAVHVGVGADAAVAARPLKARFKIAAFPIGGLIAGIRAKGLRLRVAIDGRSLWHARRRRVLMAGVANTSSIAGGTATFGPDATVTDGRFDVTVSLAVGPLARIGYAVQLIRGTHPQRADVVHRQARTLTIQGDAFHTNADGEIAGPFTRRTWTLQPGAWRCVLPTPNPADPAATGAAATADAGASAVTATAAATAGAAATGATAATADDAATAATVGAAATADDAATAATVGAGEVALGQVVPGSRTID